MAKVKPNLDSSSGAIKFKDSEEVYLQLSRLEGAHQADSAGQCDRCTRSYRKGDWLFRDEGQLVAANCCGNPNDHVAGAMDMFDTSDAFGSDLAVPLDQVLPTGRTKKDMCPRCFIIPASNGTCGC